MPAWPTQASRSRQQRGTAVKCNIISGTCLSPGGGLQLDLPTLRKAEARIMKLVPAQEMNLRRLYAGCWWLQKSMLRWFRMSVPSRHPLNTCSR